MGQTMSGRLRADGSGTVFAVGLPGFKEREGDARDEVIDE
jgi:hypothetical protein